jgi:RHS repeat-associated protein
VQLYLAKDAMNGLLPVCELSSSGSVTATNTFGPSGLLYRKAGTAQTFYTFDPSGNVCQRLNETGTLLSTHSFDAYGSYARTANTDSDPFSGYGGQAGYVTDWETGLQLCGFRYYDAAAGRWINRDPIGYAGGINLYGYVGNNPINFADPSGLFMDDTLGGQMLNPSTWAAGLTTSGSALLCLLGFCNPCHASDPGFGVSKACWNVAMQAGLMAATGGLGEAGMAGGAGEAGLAGEAVDAAEAAGSGGYSRVGRWMSQAEHDAMKATGKVQSNINTGQDMMHITVPPNPDAYLAAKPGSIFAEFDVPNAQLTAGGKPGWGIVYGPNSIYGRLAAQQGNPLTGMPDAMNIFITQTK